MTGKIGTGKDPRAEDEVRAAGCLYHTRRQGVLRLRPRPSARGQAHVSKRTRASARGQGTRGVACMDQPPSGLCADTHTCTRGCPCSAAWRRACLSTCSRRLRRCRTSRWAWWGGGCLRISRPSRAPSASKHGGQQPVKLRGVAWSPALPSGRPHLAPLTTSPGPRQAELLLPLLHAGDLQRGHHRPAEPQRDKPAGGAAPGRCPPPVCPLVNGVPDVGVWDAPACTTPAWCLADPSITSPSCPAITRPQIREDMKRGCFVEGLSEEGVQNGAGCRVRQEWPQVA